jgi:CheY-like chemotaxis protein
MEEKNTTSFAAFPLGFSAFEKSTMEMFFRLSTHASPRWALADDPAKAAVVLISATAATEVQSALGVLRPWQKILIVGDSDFGMGLPYVPRPIRLTLMQKQLNALVGAAAVPKVQPSVSVRSVAPAARVEQDFAKTRPATLEMSRRASASTGAGSIYAKLPSQQGNADKRVLVVDDSDVALRFMQNRLRHFGYESSLARSGEEALTLVATHEYRFVFLDVMMTGLDGYQTCRAIKQNKQKGMRTPVVVMLTSKGGTIDKIRGTMAGCDAYLTKPLSDRQLASVMLKYDSSGQSTFGESGLVVDMGIGFTRRNDR